MLLRTQINNWLQDPVTQEMISILKEHRDLNQEALIDSIMNGNALDPKNLQDLAQLKGGILTLDQVINIKDYLLDKSEDQEETKNEVSGIRKTSFS